MSEPTPTPDEQSVVPTGNYRAVWKDGKMTFVEATLPPPPAPTLTTLTDLAGQSTTLPSPPLPIPGDQSGPVAAPTPDAAPQEPTPPLSKVVTFTGDFATVPPVTQEPPVPEPDPAPSFEEVYLRATATLTPDHIAAAVATDTAAVTDTAADTTPTDPPPTPSTGLANAVAAIGAKVRPELTPTELAVITPAVEEGLTELSLGYTQALELIDEKHLDITPAQREAAAVRLAVLFDRTLAEDMPSFDEITAATAEVFDELERASQAEQGDRTDNLPTELASTAPEIRPEPLPVTPAPAEPESYTDTYQRVSAQFTPERIAQAVAFDTAVDRAVAAMAESIHTTHDHPGPYADCPLCQSPNFAARQTASNHEALRVALASGLQARMELPLRETLALALTENERYWEALNQVSPSLPAPVVDTQVHPASAEFDEAARRVADQAAVDTAVTAMAAVYHANQSHSTNLATCPDCNAPANQEARHEALRAALASGLQDALEAPLRTMLAEVLVENQFYYSTLTQMLAIAASARSMATSTTTQES